MWGESNAIKRFLKLESAAGILLVAATILALAVTNSPLALSYQTLLATPLVVKFGSLGLDKPLLLWINDGLMAVFFFLVGLEIKREILEGELSQPAQVILPASCAIGGMAAPAAIYVLLNWSDAQALSGWAIPAATDIAFALGALALLGPAATPPLKLFLLAVAIIDDLGAILIIAIFYTGSLSTIALLLAGGALILLLLFNLLGIAKPAPYFIVGFLLWFCVLKSGVHATLAGVATALFIPLESRSGERFLERLEHAVHPYVAFGILPIFAFANAGVPLGGLTLRDLLGGVPLGIALGLFLGKQLGVFGLAAILVRAGWTRLPAGLGWTELYGLALLAGIGFTMSLFLGGLAFEDPAQAAPLRLGVLIGSIGSAVAGFAVLRLAAHKRSAAEAIEPKGTL
jgi:Na+:H+ antiporter, NhaA family